MLRYIVQRLFLFFLLFITLSRQNGINNKLHIDCYDFLLPYERFTQNSLTECPSGLQWHESVQLCCASDQHYKLAADTVGIFFQQRYMSTAADLSPNDFVPNGCIRAIHFPNESLVHCSPSSSSTASSSYHFTSILTIPVKENIAQNIYCCLPEFAATNKIKFQNVYHGTIAANYKSGTKNVSIRAACNQISVETAKDAASHSGDLKCTFTAKDDVYDYNRGCCIPKFDYNLITDGEFQVEIKIRTSLGENNAIEHVNVNVGDYEYDFTFLGPRRRIFNRSKDLLHANDSVVKAKPFKHQPLFANSKKADALFWQMSQQNFLQPSPAFFGLPNGYDKSNHNCVDFVYEFVCNLFNGNCPSAENWPENFVQIDRELNKSFSFKETTIQIYGTKNECNLRKHELRIEYPIHKHSKHGTPVVEYETGTLDSGDGLLFGNVIKSDRDVKQLIEQIRVQQKCYVESLKHDGTVVVCKASLDVCAGKYVTNLRILDSTLSYELKREFDVEVNGIVDFDDLGTIKL